MLAHPDTSCYGMNYGSEVSDAKFVECGIKRVDSCNNKFVLKNYTTKQKLTRYGDVTGAMATKCYLLL